MQEFHQAVDTSVSAEIVQRIAADVEQTDFKALIGNAASGNYYALPMRYYDDQGTEISVANPLQPSSSELARILYWVRVRGSLPGAADPARHTASYFTSLPSTGPQRYTPRASTFLTIQIVANPAGIDLKGMIGAEDLIDEARASAVKLRLQTYSIVVSRNGY